MSAFSNLDASSNTAGLFAYLDETDHGLSAMKSYIAATARRYAHDLPVLDLGCGVGHDLSRLAQFGVHPIGLDISATALARSKERGYPVVRGDGARLPFVTDAFAACRVERVLQHVERPEDVLAEVVRVVRSGGLVAVFEPDWHTFRVASELVPDGTLPGRFVSVRHPTIGADVSQLLRSRGCAIDDVVTEKSFSYRVDALPLDAERVTQRGVDAGHLDPDLRAAWLEEQRERTRTGAFHATWSKILTVARVGPSSRRVPSL